MAGSLQIKKTNSGKKYYYTLIDVYDENGKRHQKWQATGLTVEGNKKKAQAILRERIKQNENINYSTNSEMQFHEWIEQWLNSVKNEIELSTWEGYYYPVQHIICYFKNKKLKLNQLKPIHFERYYNHMLTNGNATSKAKKGLSVKTVRQHRLVINLALKRAVILGILTFNPAENVKVANKKNSDYKKPLHMLTLSEARNLLTFLYESNDELADCVKATLYFGLRKSELLGLTEKSIDFKNHKLHITKTVVKVKTTYEKDRTKTQSSRRVYCLTSDMEDFLKSVLNKKRKNRLFYGDTYINSDYLFTWDDGKAYSPDYIYHHFKKMITKFGRPEITFHDLRHSTASILYEQGWEVKDIQEWLGHSDVQTTLNIYTHLSKIYKEEKVKSLKGIFDKNNENVRTNVRTEEKIINFTA